MSLIVLQTVGSAALVVSLMFAIGLKLQRTQLTELITRRAMLAWSVLVNILLIPALAWAAAGALGLPAPVRIGVMLCAAAPGGPTSALYSTTARADLAQAAGMTILLPAIGVLSTPLILSFAVDLPAGARVPVAPMIATLITFQIIPLAAGMAIRRRQPKLADKLAPYASAVANAILGVLVVGLSVTKGKLMLGISGPTWAVLVGVTLLALGLGYLSGRSSGRDVKLREPGRRRDSGRAGALVAACRNVSVAIMLASTFFTDAVVDVTVLTFGFVTFSLPLGLALCWRGWDERGRG